MACNVSYVSGLGKVDKQGLHGAGVDPRPKGLAYSMTPSLLQRQSTSQGNMGDSEPPDILCESCLYH